MNIEEIAGYEEKINKAQKTLGDADFVIIGAGAGLSDAAGIKYSGKRFTDNFKEFIDRFNFTDLYTSSFYPFTTEEERWAYWAKHITINRYDIPATQLYLDLWKLLNEKDYFVITTNVESQFAKAGFSKEKIFAVQGDYGYLQCARGCHPKLYYNKELVTGMVERTTDCRIPSEMVPYCPVCGGTMDVNLRKDSSFIEDKNWKEANQRYHIFLNRAKQGKTVLLELGVGFNTPGIIRYPFEELTYNIETFTLIRMNTQHPNGYELNYQRTISFDQDINVIIEALLAN